MLKKIKLSAKDWVADHNKRVLDKKRFEGLKMCNKCYTFYYKNSWHFEKPQYLETNSENEVVVRFTECPACLEQELATYEMESELVLGRV